MVWEIGVGVPSTTETYCARVKCFQYIVINVIFGYQLGVQEESLFPLFSVVTTTVAEPPLDFRTKVGT